MSERDKNAQPLYRRIIVGVDGSASATAALVHACRLADAFDAQLTVVTVWSVPIGYDGLVTGIDLERDARLAVDEIITAQTSTGDRERISIVTRAGAPAHELIAQSRSADLLVVGSRGRGGFAGLVMGSVSAQCAAHAACPVLVHHGSDVDGDTVPR
ncbi:universal stress protein [Microbacterium oleivorans]|uniref:universal stress protein n=1 Tax=Microbacterium oleivorans TaxID=273677 RepID=UPI0010A31F6F|nr:universal stress protein [Microbacterium oleivorans]THE07504.1 universal stress protein [Microbacterium oleivorans]